MWASRVLRGAILFGVNVFDLAAKNDVTKSVPKTALFVK
jgi:hypothetical protein